MDLVSLPVAVGRKPLIPHCVRHGREERRAEEGAALVTSSPAMPALLVPGPHFWEPLFKGALHCPNPPGDRENENKLNLKMKLEGVPWQSSG